MFDDREIGCQAIFALLEQRVHRLGGWVEPADPVSGGGAAHQKEHFLGLLDTFARFQRCLAICLHPGSDDRERAGSSIAMHRMTLLSIVLHSAVSYTSAATPAAHAPDLQTCA